MAQWLMLGATYFLIAIAFAFTAVLAIAGVWAIIATASRVAVGASLVGIAFVTETAFIAAPAVPLGIQLSSNDLAFGTLAAAVLYQVLTNQESWRKPALGIWLTLCTVFLASLAIGLIEFGSKAGVEARPNFYFLMAGVYFASFSYPPEVLNSLWRIARRFAWLVALVVIYRWVGLKFGFVSERLVEEAGAGSEFRVVGSGPAFFIAAVGVGYTAFWLRTSKPTAFTSAVFMLGLALVLQHRTVWVATTGSLLILAWHERKAVAAKKLPILGVGLVMLGLVVTLLALSPSSRLAESMAHSASSVTESRGTHIARMLGWEELLSDFAQSGPKTWLIGNPFGTGYERVVLGQVIAFSPHNFFIQILLRLGGIGLLMFLWAHFALRRQLVDGVSFGLIDPAIGTAFLALLFASFLYYIPYQGFYLQGALYGVLIGYVATNMRTVATCGIESAGSLQR